MSLKSKLGLKSSAMLVFSIFYVIAGGVMFFLLVASSFTAPPHVGVLAFLSLITAYSLIQMKKWAVLLTTILFFLVAAFSIPVLFAEVNRQIFSSSLGALLFNLALIIYVTFSLFAFVYVAAKRDDFE
ncbi:MAG: hypothetical protein JSV57_04985 [Candidatus Bathyarchaeota archaeon]|nr:MAG: hypothetical protein JSV57_04985 [Candidatus Bathyarchaeota archaeon]